MPLLRDFGAAGHLEAFFVSAVFAVLGIRFLLSVGDYFQLSPAGLHIAHVLWGGLLMLAATLGFLLFLPRASKRLFAVIGGVGFGTFIDEVGKFVTRDNDYFFRPAIAVIYVVLVLAVIGARAIRRRDYSREEYLANALAELEGAALDDFDAEEQRRALFYLSRADPSHPLVPQLRAAVLSSMLVPVRRPWFAVRTRERFRAFYRKVAALPWFDDALAAFFVIRIIVALAVVLVTIVLPRIEEIPEFPAVLQPFLGRFASPGPADYAESVSTLMAAALAAAGVAGLRRNRLAAFRMFERSILVSIMLTQVFAFYRRELLAMIGLVFHILLLIAVQYMTERERVRVGPKEGFE